MDLNGYIMKVYEDAEEQMAETYDLLSWDEMWSDLCSSSMVTGRECGRYCGITREEACYFTKDLIWDFDFQAEYRETMGCDIVADNEYDPEGFDVDVRLFCMMLLEGVLRERYAAMAVFDDCAHVDLPKEYLR